ncbi:MAG: VTT domain-containing protein [Thermomicrobiales bacterium]|nr:VTT domain-containing protein [Thermomicrobiales bacterium]
MFRLRGSAIEAGLLGALMGYGLPIVTLVMFVSATGVPTGVPVKLIMLFTGAYLVPSWQMLAPVILVMALAELGGTLVLHGIARTGGVKVLARIANDRQARVQASFEQWQRRLGGRDVAAIAVLRLIPFVRMGTTVGAGLIGLKLRDFVMGSAIAALIWAGVPLLLGYIFRANLADIEAAYHTAMGALPMTLGFLGLGICAFVLFRSPATRIKMRTALRLSQQG